MKIKKLKAVKQIVAELENFDWRKRSAMETTKQKRKMIKEEIEYETLRNLGGKLLNKNFAKLLSA